MNDTKEPSSGSISNIDPKQLEAEKISADTQASVSKLSTEVVPIKSNAATENKISGAISLPFVEVIPHPYPVNPSVLLDEISIIIRRYVVLEKEQADAATLWITFTWLIDVVEVAPLAIISAPERECGKSQLLDVMGRLSARPLPASNITTAVLFRAITHWQPTLLIDEVDTFLRENIELKGLINAGHTRANAFVLRVVGDNFEPKKFSVWGAKALAGIALEKHLADSTMSRAIVFNLRRKLPHEKISSLRHADNKIFLTLTSKLARFAEDYSQLVRLARPVLPDNLSDRAKDNFEPLFAIAECAGPDWLERAKAAALKLSGASKDAVSTSNELLADIQFVFESQRIGKISTVDLITALVGDPENSWATYNRGKPLSPRQLAKHLAVYGIKSKTVRFGHETPKGYELSQFEDAFKRYLTPREKLPQQRNAPQESSTGIKGNVADNLQQNLSRNETATPDALQVFGHSIDADENDNLQTQSEEPDPDYS